VQRQKDPSKELEKVVSQAHRSRVITVVDEPRIGVTHSMNLYSTRHLTREWPCFVFRFCQISGVHCFVGLDLPHIASMPL